MLAVTARVQLPDDVSVRFTHGVHAVQAVSPGGGRVVRPDWRATLGPATFRQRLRGFPAERTGAKSLISFAGARNLGLVTSLRLKGGNVDPEPSV